MRQKPRGVPRRRPLQPLAHHPRPERIVVQRRRLTRTPSGGSPARAACRPITATPQGLRRHRARRRHNHHLNAGPATAGPHLHQRHGAPQPRRHPRHRPQPARPVPEREDPGGARPVVRADDAEPEDQQHDGQHSSRTGMALLGRGWDPVSRLPGRRLGDQAVGVGEGGG